MLSLDSFGSRSLYPPPLATSRVCRRRREAADLDREQPSEFDRRRILTLRPDDLEAHR
jgi:hypothetical protein